jgi:hypothetical protein
MDDIEDIEDTELVIFFCVVALFDIGAFILDIAFSNESILFSNANDAVTEGGCFTVYVIGKRPISPLTLRP